MSATDWGATSARGSAPSRGAGSFSGEADFSRALDPALAPASPKSSREYSWHCDRA